MPDLHMPASAFDAEELYHLGMQAMRDGNSEKALLFLKQSLAQKASPQTAYLLGAQYADLGMHERAIEFIDRALSQAPDMHVARLQLALLHLIKNDNVAAGQTAKPLAALPSDDSMHHYGIALLALADNQHAQAVQALRSGLEKHNPNEPLHADMSNLLARLEASDNLPPASEKRETPPADIDEAASNFLLSSYRGIKSGLQ